MCYEFEKYFMIGGGIWRHCTKSLYADPSSSVGEVDFDDLAHLMTNKFTNNDIPSI